ncbi:unnamed protein product [Enterobius vermicularis]|uniref:Uncharacterized protein n=1 Tax=Enterobius vermicularis TaxID=51028 RepID=A0A0N4UX49_ENTVE|nr:unnamed protein product [Enterobius vermicularis]
MNTKFMRQGRSGTGVLLHVRAIIIVRGFRVKAGLKLYWPLKIKETLKHQLKEAYELPQELVPIFKSEECTSKNALAAKLDGSKMRKKCSLLMTWARAFKLSKNEQNPLLAEKHQLDISVAEYRSRQFLNDCTPVSRRNFADAGRVVCYSAPQPLMTSTPKTTRRPSLKSLHELEDRFSKVGSSDHDAFDEKVKSRKESCKRALTYGDESLKHILGKSDGSSNEESDRLMVGHATKDNDEEASKSKVNAALPNSPVATSELQNNELVAEEEVPFSVDPVEGRDVESLSEW